MWADVAGSAAVRQLGWLFGRTGRKNREEEEGKRKRKKEKGKKEKEKKRK